MYSLRAIHERIINAILRSLIYAHVVASTKFIAIIMIDRRSKISGHTKGYHKALVSEIILEHSNGRFFCKMFCSVYVVKSV